MRLTLQIQTGSLAGRQYFLEQGSLTLGRGADRTVCFSSALDPTVSTNHATIERRPDGFYLIDNRSTNGTIHNNRLISETKLQHGDVIQLGSNGPVLRVFIEAVRQPQAAFPQQSLAARQQAAFNPAAQQGFRHTVTNLGFYNPDKHTSPERQNYVGIALGIGLAFIMTLIVALIMLSSIGLVGAFIGTIMAFLPAPFYLFLFLWLDRYDPEPAWALIASFAWGGLFAVIVSFIVNTIFGTVAIGMMGEAGDALSAIISAPIIEEATKGLGVVAALLLLRKEFDDILDGIVYAGVIALGFATVENVLYYGRAFLSGGGVGLFFVMFLRGVLSPFSHSLFTSMTGIGCGIARETHNKALKFIAPLGGYLAAVFLHALWNTIASLVGLVGFIVLYLVIWLPLFLIFIGVIIYLARREAKLIREMLAIEVARGLISQSDVELVSSYVNRTKWLLSSLSNTTKLQARRRFLRAVSKLALCHWHVARASAANNQTRSLPLIPQFQAQILELKGQI
ncbi:MAG: PrsW family glutamic-type intramembrane protease [Acidobacteriota bacterium]|nr:PrsW family glutamic-type intramembrane protease [Blastocatellia bacterium]MDW8412064.1 PrsW family glutamic-type intramembrane protease [Acidobacteriota bacterium]